MIKIFVLLMNYCAVVYANPYVVSEYRNEAKVKFAFESRGFSLGSFDYVVARAIARGDKEFLKKTVEHRDLGNIRIPSLFEVLNTEAYFTPLQLAAFFDYSDIVRFLIEELHVLPAQNNYKGEHELYTAIRMGSVKTIEYLMGLSDLADSYFHAGKASGSPIELAWLNLQNCLDEFKVIENDTAMIMIDRITHPVIKKVIVFELVRAEMKRRKIKIPESVEKSRGLVKELIGQISRFDGVNRIVFCRTAIQVIERHLHNIRNGHLTNNGLLITEIIK